MTSPISNLPGRSLRQDVPERNALNNSIAGLADGAINAGQSGSAAASRRSFPGQEHNRVAVWQRNTRQRTSPLSTLPPEILDCVIESALSGNPSIQDVTRLRCTNSALNEGIGEFMRRPEQREVALRMTRTSITNLARSTQFNDEEFQARVTRLIDRNTHIGVDLSRIPDPRRLQIILACLSNAANLCTVDLNASGMPDRIAAVMASINAMSARNPQLSRFVLDVSSNNIDVEGARELAANPVITKLDARLNNLGEAGARALAAHPTITQLDVRYNRIGDAGAQALALNSTITHLNVCRNRIGSAGAQALAANSTITKLDLGGNRIGDAGAQALASNATITQLDVGGNDLNVAAAVAFAQNRIITQLDMCRNNIGDAGARALSANTTITQLHVSWNRITATGVQALAANAIITELDVGGNDIDIAGAQALAANTTLKKLNVRFTFLDIEAVIALRNSTTLTQLTT